MTGKLSKSLHVLLSKEYGKKTWKKIHDIPKLSNLPASKTTCQADISRGISCPGKCTLYLLCPDWFFRCFNVGQFFKAPSSL